MKQKRGTLCKECPLYDREEVPFSNGTKNSIMVVGQSPGRDEVTARRPFIGRSGQLLRDVAKIAGGIDLDEAFVANSLRCYEGTPALTGNALRKALSCCYGFLRNAYEKLQPNLIISLGNHALLQLTKKSGIVSHRGKIITTEEWGTVIPLLHPAAVLRECTAEYPNKPMELMSMRERDFFHDWKMVGRYIRNDYTEDKVDTSKYVWGTAADLNLIGKASILSVDFETANADLYDPHNKVVSVSFTIDHGKSYVYKPPFSKRLLGVLANGSVKLLCARPFDEHVCRLLLKMEMGGPKIDVLTLAHVADENYHVFNLENVAYAYAGMKQIKRLSGEFRGRMSEAPDEVLRQYNGVDTDATYRSGVILLRKLKRIAPLSRYYKNFITPVQNMIEEISLYGCRIDTGVLRTNETQTEGILHAMEQELISACPASLIKRHIKVGKRATVSRPDFVREMVFKSLKKKPFPEFLTKKTKQPRVTEDHLSLFASNPWVAKYLRYKKLDKIRTYFPGLWKCIKSDGRIYPSTIMCRTVTGRSVILHPAIQTYPQRGEHKDLIRSAVVADEGWLLGARDLSQSELRIMAWLAGEKVMLKAFYNGVDIHTLTASEVAGVPLNRVTKEMRRAAKGVNFGLIYGMLAPKLQAYLKAEYGIDYSSKECERIRNVYFRTYPSLQPYYEKVKTFAHKYGYVESPLGRRRRLPAINDKDTWAVLEAERQAVNAPIQSFSSDLGLIGMFLFWEEIKKRGWQDRMYPLWFIHDAIVFTAKEEVMKTAMSLLRHCMEKKAPHYIATTFGVRVGYEVISEGKIGQNWAAMKEME